MNDEKFMRLALHEARKGLGRTSPNPCVGAIIVKDDEVVGAGYHKKAGTPHAEVNALADAGEKASGATIYVTLEPCNHHGRTPPCTEAVLAAGIQRVVVGMNDPNPLVDGGGCDYLTSRGLTVMSGVLEDECRALNYPFVKHSSTGLPWVVLKAGMSLDGRITYTSGCSGWITGKESHLRVHQMRDHFDCIMVGVETALIDNPSLTTRLPEGQGRDPLRVVLDTHLRLSPRARMLNLESAAPTWIFCSPEVDSEKKKKFEDAGAVIRQVALTPDGHLDLQEVLEILGKSDLISVLVEGGATLHGTLLRRKFVDQVFLYMAPIFIGDKGTSLVRGYAVQSADQAIRLRQLVTTPLGGDLLIEGLVV